jgi:hypothetical protein
MTRRQWLDLRSQHQVFENDPQAGVKDAGFRSAVKPGAIRQLARRSGDEGRPLVLALGEVFLANLFFVDDEGPFVLDVQSSRGRMHSAVTLAQAGKFHGDVAGNEGENSG